MTYKAIPMGGTVCMVPTDHPYLELSPQVCSALKRLFDLSKHHPDEAQHPSPRIDAILLLRAIKPGLGLREAKEMVEAIAAHDGNFY
jgi:hypothetical protein